MASARISEEVFEPLQLQELMTRLTIFSQIEIATAMVSTPAMVPPYTSELVFELFLRDPRARFTTSLQFNDGTILGCMHLP